MLAGLVLCEMLSQYPQSAFQGSPRVAGGVSSSLRPKPSASICSVSNEVSQVSPSVSSKVLGLLAALFRLFEAP